MEFEFLRDHVGSFIQIKIPLNLRMESLLAKYY